MNRAKQAASTDQETIRTIGAALGPQVDLDALVEAIARFTPADIGHAARTAAQTAFERHLARGGPPGAVPGSRTTTWTRSGAPAAR
ncbi:hypothetical protein ACQP1V_34195 [Microtetraspora malaysiensis]|uniref:hypothetical protein n=1 Tax=Microtetraspora malaysiensis TaxID=161358 RepID=UPI003D92941F